MRLSLVIPVRDENDPKLWELLASIHAQDFPKDELEILTITEGTSESAKAIGIRRAKGDVIGFLASDNELIHEDHLSYMYKGAFEKGYSYSLKYHHQPDDDALNRYFALIGGNDPLCYYMGKNDKRTYFDYSNNRRGSIGDNGFFIRKSLIEKTDLDNYYHIDNAIEATEHADYWLADYPIWHKTGGNFFKFFQKRYRYGLQHAFNPSRRWHLVDFSRKEDICRLVWFIVASLTLIHPLMTSIRGYRKLQDMAWFYHPIVCLATVFTYGVLVIHVTLRRIFQSSSAPMVAQRA